MKRFLKIIFCLSYYLVTAQPVPAITNWEILPLQVSSNISTYRGRNENDRTFGQGISSGISVFLPFQWHIQKLNNASDSLSKAGFFYNRQFWFRPLITVQITNDWSSVTASSFSFNFKLNQKMFLSFQSGIAWIEAKSHTQDGLYSGFNLIQALHMGYALNSHWAIGTGIQHISPAHIFKGESNQDAISLSVQHQF